MTVTAAPTHRIAPRLVPHEQRIETFEADLDLGGAPCPVTLLLTTRRLMVLPDGAPAAPSPHRLAAPWSITLAGLVLREQASEVALLTEDGVARLQFATRRRALAFTLSVNGAIHALAT